MRTLTAAEIVEGWHESLVRAMRRGDADAAYQLARVFVRRCRELQLVLDDDARTRRESL